MLPRCVRADTHSCRTPGCKQATRANRCHKIAIGIYKSISYRQIYLEFQTVLMGFKCLYILQGRHHQQEKQICRGSFQTHQDPMQVRGARLSGVQAPRRDTSARSCMLLPARALPCWLRQTASGEMRVERQEVRVTGTCACTTWSDNDPRKASHYAHHSLGT